MLQALRDRSGRWFFRLFFVLIALSFVAMGVIEAVRNYHAARPVAKIGRKSVGFDHYSYALQKTIQNIRAKDPKITNKDLHRLNIFQNVLDEQIRALVIEQELENHKLFVPETLLKATVESLPFFHKDGKFQIELLHAYLQASNISEAEFVKRIHRHLLLQQLMKPLGDTMHLPQSYLQGLMKILYTPHHFMTMEIPFDALKIEKKPTVEELKETYQNNREKYLVAETRQAKVLSFKSSDLIKRIPVSDEEIRNIYLANKEKFVEPERRHVHMVIYPSKSMAQMAYDHLQKKDELSTIFITVPGGTYKNLGLLTKDKAPQEFANIIFSAKQKGVLPPLASKTEEHGGFVVLYIETIELPHTKPFKDIKKQLGDDIRLERSVKFIDDFRNQIEDRLGAGASLEEVAKHHNISLTSYNINQTGEALKHLPAEIKNSLITKIFRLAPSQVTPILDLSAGDFYVVQLHKITPAYTPRFEKMQERVKQDWEFKKQKEKANNYAQKFEQLSFKKAQGQTKGLFKIKEKIIRPVDILSGHFKEFSDYATKKIFALKEQTATSFENLNARSLSVVWYKNSKILEKIPEEAAPIEEKLKEGFQEQKEFLIINAMEGNYKKEIYQNVVEEAYP